MITTPLVIAALPTPPTTLDPVNFDARQDAFGLAEQAMVPQLNTANVATYNNAVDALVSATGAQVAAVAAAASAASAAASAGAVPWVSGTTYTIGQQRTSPINLRVYRRLTAGAGTFDPGLDPVNWAAVSTGLPVVVSSALVTQAQPNTSYACTWTGNRTNLLLRSNEFDNAVWIKNQTSVTPNSAVAPDGTTTADTVTILAPSAIGNTYIYADYSTTVHANQPFVASVDLKTGTFSGDMTLYLEDGSFSAINTVQVVLATGWKRIYLSGTFGSSPAAGIKFAIAFANGTAGQTVFIANAQLETGLVASPHILSGATQGVSGPALVLPAQPADGDKVTVRPQRTLTNFVVGRNNQLIKGRADDMLIDVLDQVVTFEFINSSWEIS